MESAPAFDAIVPAPLRQALSGDQLESLQRAYQRLQSDTSSTGKSHSDRAARYLRESASETQPSWVAHSFALYLLFSHFAIVAHRREKAAELAELAKASKAASQARAIAAGNYAPHCGCGYHRCNNGWVLSNGTEYPCNG